jgi:hypothetical protein
VSDGVSARVTPDAFVQALWAEVERHPALTHLSFAKTRPARKWLICRL